MCNGFLVESGEPEGSIHVVDAKGPWSCAQLGVLTELLSYCNLQLAASSPQTH